MPLVFIKLKRKSSKCKENLSNEKNPHTVMHKNGGGKRVKDATLYSKNFET